jgi:cation transport ATPase
MLPPWCRRGRGIRTDVARGSADIILVGCDVPKFVETLRVARRCHGIIMQNFLGTLLVDSIGVALAGFGFLNPVVAGFICVAFELGFILNSTRLLSALAKAGE